MATSRTIVSGPAKIHRRPRRWRQSIDANATQLATAMATAHGGKWAVHVDHGSTGFILIRATAPASSSKGAR